MPNWTDEQLAAIRAYDEPIIVSAAAGSGKTAVLVERTVRLLCDESKGIPADSLLAVTFTNDAASQMKEKLCDALEKAAYDQPNNAWIRRQQSLLKLGDICTINSFCFDMVRNHLEMTEFQSGVRIMEENESEMLTERALTAVLENEYSTRRDEVERLISLFCKENDTALRTVVLQLYKFLRTQPFKELWTSRVISSLSDGSALDIAVAYETSRAKGLCRSLKNVCEKLRNTANELSRHASAREMLLKACFIAEELCEIPSTLDWDNARSAFLKTELGNISFKGVRQKKDEKLRTTPQEERLYESSKDLFNRVKEIVFEISDIYFCSLSEAKKDTALTLECFLSLVKITDELSDEVMRMKVERNATDFTDTELLTVRLLASHRPDGELERTELAKEIRKSGRYRIILIDEFQDVNNLQEVIFKAISDTDNMGEIGKNVFAVGDVKQAIYRFRQANPLIFMRTRALGKSPDSPVREMLLTKNFRSRSSVIDFCNYVFSSLMTDELGEVEYTRDEELVTGAEYRGDDPLCTIIEIDSEDKSSSQVEELEYTAIARKIRNMISSGVTVKDGEDYRPCRASDFCVLSRNNPDGKLVTECFEREGLKVASAGVSGYLGSREISLLINLLSVTVSPMRDIPMASVMLSKVMCFSDDELARVKIYNKSNRLYRNMLDISNDENCDDTLRDKCDGAVRLVKRLRLLSSSLPLTRLIKKIYDTVDLMSLAASYLDGDKKCANLNLMLEYAKSYEQSSKDGLSGFLRYIDYISQNGGDFAEAVTVTESQDAVNFKTIHKSKGLEYPFVFICRLSKKFNRRDIYSRLLLNSESGVGVGMSFLDYSTLTKKRTLLCETVAAKNTSEMLSEELRLLYVAMTRAKEQLFILMTNDESTRKQASVYSYEIDSHAVMPSLSVRAQSMQDWLIMALCKHPTLACAWDCPCEAFDDKSGLPNISLEMPLPKPEYSVTDSEKEAIKDISCGDSDLEREILDAFSYENNSLLTKTEAKVSVSELAGDDPVNFFPKVPKLWDTVSEFSAAQKGTLMHRFMQCADYEAAALNVDKEIERLCAGGVFAKREAEALDRKALRTFFESEIYSRMSRSVRVMREKSFIVKFSDIDTGGVIPEVAATVEAYRGTDGMMQGIADCVFEEDNGFVIVDYKTDNVSDMGVLVRRYIMQLCLYKAAFAVILGKPIKSCYIYSLKLAESAKIEDWC